jgi:hypothetical protein
MANTFNTYFSTVAQHIHTENSKNSNSVVSENNPLNYLYDPFKQTIPSIKLKFVSPKEIEEVVLLKRNIMVMTGFPQKS